MSAGSPAKVGRSLLTSSRLRSIPPAERLKGAAEPHRKRGEILSLPSQYGVSIEAVNATRCVRSTRLRDQSFEKSAGVVGSDVLTMPSSISRASVYPKRHEPPNPFLNLR